MIGRRPHRLDEMCWCGVQSASPMDHGGSYSTPPQVVRFDLEASGHDGRAAVRALHGKARELVGPDVEYQFDAVELHPEEIAFNGDVLSVRAAGSGSARLYQGDIWHPDPDPEPGHRCEMPMIGTVGREMGARWVCECGQVWQTNAADPQWYKVDLR